VAPIGTRGHLRRARVRANWVFTVDGDKEHLRDVDLVLTYQAR
jgi:hypothetical protein